MINWRRLIRFLSNEAVDVACTRAKVYKESIYVIRLYTINSRKWHWCSKAKQDDCSLISRNVIGARVEMNLVIQTSKPADGSVAQRTPLGFDVVSR